MALAAAGGAADAAAAVARGETDAGPAADLPPYVRSRLRLLMAEGLDKSVRRCGVEAPALNCSALQSSVVVLLCQQRCISVVFVQCLRTLAVT